MTCSAFSPWVKCRCLLARAHCPGEVIIFTPIVSLSAVKCPVKCNIGSPSSDDLSLNWKLPLFKVISQEKTFNRAFTLWNFVIGKVKAGFGSFVPVSASHGLGSHGLIWCASFHVLSLSDDHIGRILKMQWSEVWLQMVKRRKFSLIFFCSELGLSIQNLDFQKQCFFQDICLEKLFKRQMLDFDGISGVKRLEDFIIWPPNFLLMLRVVRNEYWPHCGPGRPTPHSRHRCFWHTTSHTQRYIWYFFWSEHQINLYCQHSISFWATYGTLCKKIPACHQNHGPERVSLQVYKVMYLWSVASLRRCRVPNQMVSVVVSGWIQDIS